MSASDKRLMGEQKFSCRRDWRQEGMVLKMLLLKYMSMRPLLRTLRDASTIEGKNACTYALCKHGENGKSVLIGLQIKRKKIFSPTDKRQAIGGLILRLCGLGGSTHRDEKVKWDNDGILSQIQKFGIVIGRESLNDGGYLAVHAQHIEQSVFGELDALAKVKFPLNFNSLPYGKENWRIKYID